MYSILSKKVIYPLGDKLFDTSVIRYYNWLMTTQYWSPTQLRELQNTRLNILIRHAYENVPYYRNLLEERGLTNKNIKIVEDLHKLPILTKKIIRANFEEIKAINIDKYHPIKNATGGSTGDPLQYYISKDLASINWAGTFRGWNWAGYQIGDKRIAFGGSSLVPGNPPTLFDSVRSKLERNLKLSAVSMDDAKYTKYIKIIRNFRPKFIYGYPSSIFLFAEYCSNHGVNDIRFKAVFSTAEVLLPHYRQKIEAQFNCKVFDEYGSYDGGGQALECEVHKGFHISVEKVIMEIVDEDGKTVPDGQPGRIIVTDLHNYAMPFIRYDVGDISTMDERPCSCGRSLPLLKSIEGRTTDIIKLANGVSIAGPAVTLIFKECNVKQYQLIQVGNNELLIKIVKGENYSDIDENHFMNILMHHTGTGIKIGLEYCQDIPVGSNSKYRFILSKI